MEIIVYLSDMDYGFNYETQVWDVPCVEWEDCYGRWWQRFESEEARDEAIRLNEVRNNKPHIKAQIEAERKASDIEFVMFEVNDYLEFCMKEARTVELSYALGMQNWTKQFALADWRRVNQPHVVVAVSKAVVNHNKWVLKSRVAPKRTTFSLGELM